MHAVKLLLPVDGSHSAARALNLVAGYRGQKSRLVPVLLNVQSPPVMLWPERCSQVKRKASYWSSARAAAARRTMRSSAPWR